MSITYYGHGSWSNGSCATKAIYYGHGSGSNDGQVQEHNQGGGKGREGKGNGGKGMGREGKGDGGKGKGDGGKSNGKVDVGGRDTMLEERSSFETRFAETSTYEAPDPPQHESVCKLRRMNACYFL